MKKRIKLLFIATLAGFVFIQSASAVSAGTLKFGQTSYTAAVGSTFTVDVIVSPGTDAISSTDALVTYDSTAIQATSVSAGTYFPSVTNNITSGQVALYGTVSDVSSSKTGDGTIATITFTVLMDSTSTLQFACATTGTSSKIIKYDPNNINAPNVIVCSQNGTASLTGGTGSSGGNSGGGTLATPTPLTSLPTTGTVADLSVFTFAGVALIVLGGFVKLFL
jgi:LPXTG-motif cell wall-anchored protein